MDVLDNLADGRLALTFMEADLAYLDVLQNAYGGCLDLQKRHYAMERRWPEAPFWKRRQAAGYGLETM